MTDSNATTETAELETYYSDADGSLTAQVARIAALGNPQDRWEAIQRVVTDGDTAAAQDGIAPNPDAERIITEMVERARAVTYDDILVAAKRTAVQAARNPGSSMREALAEYRESGPVQAHDIDALIPWAQDLFDAIGADYASLTEEQINQVQEAYRVAWNAEMDRLAEYIAS